MNRPLRAVTLAAPLERQRLDAYLDIAYRVLREARRPLPPREILRHAFASGYVPASLYGQTQHKTLQARLSEDILLRRERSAFFRTKPGYFFLREFIADPSIPTEFRTPILARRRRRELAYVEALALDRASTAAVCHGRSIERSAILGLLRSRNYHYAPSSRNRSTDDVLIWSFVVVQRRNL
ncbi:MAG: winged helix-turn-helix domain-containing protein, partial [Polynucleobacter sp.]|nr:winged helix-turn-helix domain-containing protein [Polynucleobacter sp.]